MCSGGASPETSMTRPSSAMRLPQEIVEVIIAHLIYDTCSLLACFLTCCSWYIATVPHLHNTLVTATIPLDISNKYFWPKLFPYMHRLGLLPLVKNLKIRKRDRHRTNRFSPKRFKLCILRHFCAFTGIRELGIDYLDIPSFMPRIQQYFGHFSPTVRSLSLRAPKGTSRQIIYFIGLFQHLEDLKLLHDDDQTAGPPEGSQWTTRHSLHPSPLHCRDS